MPPHGRRRPSGLTILLSLLCLFTATASAASAVLGIDLGTEYIKAALVKPGIPLDIVLTKDSKRKETAAIAFKPLRAKVNTAESELYPERVYGGDAVALSARFPSDVYPNLKSLLGLKLNDDLVLEYRATHPGLQMVEWPETGTIGFKSDSFVAEEEPWLIEELLAMELKNIKGNAETMAGKGSIIKDAVVTVPSFYTVEERRAITLAAGLAGLRVLTLISDGLAVGLNYATSRTFPTVNEGGKPETHLVYDMGAGSTTATVLRFQGRTVKDVGKFNKTIQEVQVLGSSWDKSLGGDALNQVILVDMIEKVTESSQMKKLGLDAKHVQSHGRTMAKLWKEAERIRQVLSANTETSSTFEGLYYEDFTFKYKLSRIDFEKLASAFFFRVQRPVEEALKSAKLTIADLESVILHGGAVRTPFVQKQLEAVIRDSDKIRTNVNSDEAAVFGAAFKAAAISPSFRVKEIRAADSAVYPVIVSWSLDGKDKQQKLFVPTSQVGAEKQISVKATEDFSFSLSQQIPLPPSDLPVSEIKTHNLTDSVKSLTSKGCTLGEITTKFTVRLSPVDGLPEVVSGSVSCQITEPEIKKGGMVEGVKDLFGFGSKKGDQEPLKGDTDTNASTTSSSSSSATISSSLESSTTSVDSQTTHPSATDATKENPKEAKKKMETVYIAFSTEVTGNSGVKPDSLQRMKKRLASFDKSDRSRVYREETLNNLEGYTYKIRDLLEDKDFMEASTTQQRDEIEAKSNDASMWLYGDGAEASRETLKARLDELRGLVEPIQKRKEEAKSRPDQVQRLKDALKQAESMVAMIQQQMESQEKAKAEAASKASESESQTTEAPSASIDDFAELDDATSTSSTSTTSAPKIPEMQMPLYNKEDVNAILEKHETVQKWLDEKLAEQEKLGLTDDPVVLSSDLSAKSEEINNAVMNLITKSMKVPQMPKKAKSSKSTKMSSTSSTAADSSSVEFGESPKETTGPLDNEADSGHKITKEEIEEAMAEQKSKAEKTKKSAKAKATGKGKGKGKGKTKGKGKEKGKDEGKSEL
ncbi:hypothetical protein N7G274_008636 [Stereocaulon virgatum]|uniref:Actin-like ATPase domain-containing protein n=1 Tax=Stereocaulon virgatum TaxID=373712 RepID=A0ABR4A5G1_9LECA